MKQQKIEWTLWGAFYDMAENAFADFTALRVRILLFGENGNATLFRAKFDAAEMTQSMSQTGRCIDSALREEFRGILKSEMDDLQHFDDFDSPAPPITEFIRS